MISLRSATTALLFTALTSAILQAEPWPGFRGATGSGVSTETDLPAEWSETKNILWKTDLPGRGNSSPAVNGDRVYLTAKDSDKRLLVIAIDRKSGAIAWQKPVGAGTLAAKGPENLWAPHHNAATPTPCADETHVWAFFGTGLLICFDREGGRIWERDLASEYGAYDITFGMGSSPRLWEGRLFVACMTKGSSYLLALDPKTGKELWKTDRSYSEPDDHPDAYSTPAIRRLNGKAQVLVAGNSHLDAYDPETGGRQWFVPGFRIKSPYGRMIASPAVSQDEKTIVQLSGNPGGGGLGRALGFQADTVAGTPKQIWNYEKKSPDSSTPVCYGGLAYFFRDSGVGYALDQKSGELLWEERLARKPVFASAVAGDGKIYLLATEGLCTVIKAGRNFEKISANQLPGHFNATPAISDGVIYLRSFDALWAVGKN